MAGRSRRPTAPHRGEHGSELRLLKERPEAKGLAVPGMPIGSPGMEVPGSPPEDYAVILFGPSGRSTYARFKGATELRA